MRAKLINENLDTHWLSQLDEFVILELNKYAQEAGCYFDIENIHLYGSVITKGLKDAKDIDVFVEVSNFEGGNYIYDTVDFKEYLHEQEIYFNDKYVDINFTDYDIELDEIGEIGNYITL